MTARSVVALVELSGQNPPLAEAELDGALHALGGSWVVEGPWKLPDVGLVGVLLPDAEAGAALAGRLALARRLLRPLLPAPGSDLARSLRLEGAKGRSASFRPFGAARSPLSSADSERLAQSYVDGGGRIDLRNPERRFFLGGDPGSDRWVAEESAVVDRRSLAARRMPGLSFQRPVSLAPELGRVVVNLARVRPGHRVIDPFVGTGALLLEAALLGARVSGVDRDAAMVRGALRNFEQFGVHAEDLRIGDAGDAFAPAGGGGWDAVITDPPYGRSSGAGGEPPSDLIRRVLPRWAELVRPGGVVVVVLPGDEVLLPPPWVAALRVPDRVHRSLTREFCVYVRAGGPVNSP